MLPATSTLSSVQPQEEDEMFLSTIISEAHDDGNDAKCGETTDVPFPQKGVLQTA